MSQENVELARRGCEALAHGDMQTVLAALDPAIEVCAPGEVMGEFAEPEEALEAAGLSD
jgi:hypothetical protein